MPILIFMIPSAVVGYTLLLALAMDGQIAWDIPFRPFIFIIGFIVFCHAVRFAGWALKQTLFRPFAKKVTVYGQTVVK